MNETLIYEERDDGVAAITLNRPNVRNAFDDTLITLLINAFTKASASPQVKIVLLSANGKHFSAGADLNWMRNMASATEEENLSDARELARLMSTLNQLSKPVVTRVQGAAFGGAIGLISCSDIVIAEEQARFALSEVKLGLSPATICPYVINAIGARASRRLFLTGETFGAEHAERIGLVSEVCTANELDSKINNVVSLILKNGPVALAKTKQLIETVTAGIVDDEVTDYTCELIAELRVSDEGQEGLNAFFEKRPPRWAQVSNN